MKETSNANGVFHNVIMKDSSGHESTMVYVPCFALDEVIAGAPHVPHPAFVIDGNVLDGFYISKYQNVIIEGCACSLYDCDPATRVDFDTARRACHEKGQGYHLMTAMEWGALALLCQKNGWLPYGNNEMGKDWREERVVARISYQNEEKAICRTATGTGPLEWSHNRQADGIYDLNGNVWEWVGGIRLVYGELQVLPNNHAASAKYSQNADSEDWRAIDATSGEWLVPTGYGTTTNSVKLDFVDGKWQYVGGAVTSMDHHYRYCDFSEIRTAPDLCEKAEWLLVALGCLPIDGGHGCQGVSLYANNGAAERMAFRGGRWGQGINAGLWKTCFDDPRSYSGEAVGFRSAYYQLSSH